MAETFADWAAANSRDFSGCDYSYSKVSFGSYALTLSGVSKAYGVSYERTIVYDGKQIRVKSDLGDGENYTAPSNRAGSEVKMIIDKFDEMFKDIPKPLLILNVYYD